LAGPSVVDGHPELQSPTTKGNPVKHFIKAAAIALAVVGSTVSTLSIMTPASAQAVVTFDPGNVRYGYNDGYWDNTRAWHKWEQPAHMQTYRDYKGAKYYDYAHTRDTNQGWLEK
jgi:hypothetical protein